MMKTIEIRRDGIRRSILADAKIPGLDELTAEHERVLGQLKADEAALEEATASWRQADSDHVDELAARMRKTPGAKPKESGRVAEAEQRMQELDETVRARTRALHGIEDEIIALLDEQAPAWGGALDARIASDLEQWRTDVTALSGAASSLVENWARREWVSAIVAGGQGRVKSGDLLVHGLVGRDGTPYTLGAVLAELEHVGDPPPQPERLTLTEAAERGADKRRAVEAMQPAVA